MIHYARTLILTPAWVGRPLLCDLVGLWWVPAAEEGISSNPEKSVSLQQGTCRWQVSRDGVKRRRCWAQKSPLGNKSHPQTSSQTGQHTVRVWWCWPSKNFSALLFQPQKGYNSSWQVRKMRMVKPTPPPPWQLTSCLEQALGPVGEGVGMVNVRVVSSLTSEWKWLIIPWNY